MGNAVFFLSFSAERIFLPALRLDGASPGVQQHPTTTKIQNGESAKGVSQERE